MAVTVARARPSVRALSTHADAGWLIGAAAVLVVLCALPYLASALWGPKELERIGTFWFIKDFTQYQAAMREGAAQSGWLIHDHFSAEPHQAAFIYPLYTGAGKIAAALHVEALAVFSVLEWVGRLALLGSLYVFAATFLEDRSARRLAVVLAAGSLGLVGLLAPLHGVMQWLPDSVNVYLELSSFGVFLSAPHLMFGLALTLLCAPLYLRKNVVGLGMAVLTLSLLHSFNLPVLVSVLVAHALWNGRSWWPAAAVAVIASAPILLYNAWLFTTDPFWSGTYGAQNLMPAPTPWMLPIDLGVVLLAAPLAWTRVREWPKAQRRLLLLWIGLALLWLYVPVPYQRRFAFGVHPALSVLAAVGLLVLNQRLHRRAVNLAIAAVTIATPVLVYVALMGSAVSNYPTEIYLWSRAEADAGAWIGSQSDAEDVVLASTDFSNALVGSIDGRAVHGHIVATLHSPEKRALVRQFFSAEATSQERGELLQQSGATMVAFGPRERALGATDLTLPQLQLVYDRAGVEVFRVQR